MQLYISTNSLVCPRPTPQYNKRATHNTHPREAAAASEYIKTTQARARPQPSCYRAFRVVYIRSSSKGVHCFSIALCAVLRE
uniref:Uncharacterized protein n=1 Tax=Trichogramma kaykai TaxID=54128 RepID=A0ABD2XAE7_9HYME